ncbi:hypothetical protein EHQ12_00455 [Leptospira gomenensis]|uniref:Lipoprotein n=1 Tax=Leptospira gomenensis TaxID=2484974 RepID=A0A5F1YKB0_9LEPT|nr:hypothetical protein [Leptospira gomenensis]TGK33276.1 hypothetical protein EHQ17_10785 [Leptospira gomenensis]TGK45130.1 hypothetical protein EHQ12_00455 [Leptospira gomenensis]TGK50916.1 hypothetical protein EHQ07_03365 [Leptospira gomenensis]TGK56539.1 hypothetical protein EHQ13_15290 [Leptospira gomenensis]
MINRIPFCIPLLFLFACAGTQQTQQNSGSQNKFEKIQTAKTVVVESFVPKSVREICGKTPDPESFNPEVEPCIQRRQEELFKRIYLPSEKEKNLTKALELVLSLKKVFPKKKLLIGKEADIHVRHVQQKVEYCDSGQTNCVPVIHNVISFSDSPTHEVNKSYTVVPQLSYIEKEEKELPMAKWGERLESISRENIDFILGASFVLE